MVLDFAKDLLFRDMEVNSDSANVVATLNN